MTTVLDGQEKMDAKTAHCAVCGRNLPLRQMHEIHELRPALQAMIAEQVGDIDDQSLICERDLSRYRRLYVEKLLNDERGELSELDRRVLDSFVTGGSTVQSSADLVLEPPRSFGEGARLDDADEGKETREIGRQGCCGHAVHIVMAVGSLQEPCLSG